MPVAHHDALVQGLSLRVAPPSSKLTIRDGDGEPFQIHSGFRVNADHIWIHTNPLEYVVGVIATSQFRNTKHIGSESGDTLQAFTGTDILLGRGGDDTLAGGTGNDRLTGGEGSDIFVFNIAGLGKDRILDFDADGGAGNQDFIRGVFADATITPVGTNTVLDFGDGDVLTLLNITAAQITMEDFVA